MLASDILSAAATWRPQLFGNRRAADIADPIIEPLWTGPRVLALVDAGRARLTDVDGTPIDGHEDLVRELVEAAAGTTLLLEAALTPEPLQSLEAVAARAALPVPNVGQAVTQMVVGVRGDRKNRFERGTDEARLRSVEGTADDEVALVAVDLVWLDDESLCDVPLLERKRILESVLVESRLVRVGIHVRPPVDAWLGSWRSIGFHRIAYKAANSRYLPGQKNQHWAQAEIPAR